MIQRRGGRLHVSNQQSRDEREGAQHRRREDRVRRHTSREGRRAHEPLEPPGPERREDELVDLQHDLQRDGVQDQVADARRVD